MTSLYRLPSPKMETPPATSPAERSHRIAESLQRMLLRPSPRETLHGLTVETFYAAALAEASIGAIAVTRFGSQVGEPPSQSRTPPGKDWMPPSVSLRSGSRCGRFCASTTIPAARSGV